MKHLIGGADLDIEKVPAPNFHFLEPIPATVNKEKPTKMFYVQEGKQTRRISLPIWPMRSRIMYISML